MNRLAALTIAGVLVASCGGPPPGARKARALLKAGEYEEATRVADAELARFPTQPVLWRVKIGAAMGQRDAARAVEVYGEWMKLRGRHDRKALRSMALSTLWQGLYSPSSKVKIAAIQTAERLDLAPLAEPVAERMGDDDPAVVAAAAVAVLRSHPDAPFVARDLLDSDSARARAIVVEGIGRKAGKHARADLAAMLGDPSPEVRRAAVNVVWKFATAKDVRKLLQIATTDDTGNVRAAALRVLARKNFKGAVDAAHHALTDDYLGARLAAVALLDRRGGKGADDDLLVLSRSDDLFVALRAAVALSKRGHPSLPVEVARRALASDQWTVRAAGLNALAQAGAKTEALPVVRPATSDASVHVRLAAARALLRFGAKDAAVALFVASLNADDDSARVQAAVDLAVLKDPRGVAAIEQLATAPSPHTRLAAVRAHIQLGRPTAGLVGAIADENADVRMAAADVILSL